MLADRGSLSIAQCLFKRMGYETFQTTDDEISLVIRRPSSQEPSEIALKTKRKMTIDKIRTRDFKGTEKSITLTQVDANWQERNPGSKLSSSWLQLAQVTSAAQVGSYPWTIRVGHWETPFDPQCLSVSPLSHSTCSPRLVSERLTEMLSGIYCLRDSQLQLWEQQWSLTLGSSFSGPHHFHKSGAAKILPGVRKHCHNNGKQIITVKGDMLRLYDSTLWGFFIYLFSYI